MRCSYCTLQCFAGMNLRRVERSGEEKKRDVGSDVASILKRRIAVEISDTESDSDFDDTDSEWST